MTALHLTLPAHGLRVRAELLPEMAPDTCEVFSQIVPTREPMLVRHAIFSGRQVGIHLPESIFASADQARGLRQEYLTAFPAPGDVLWQYCPAGVLGPEEVFDLAICYGPDSRVLMPWGFSPANRFGRVVTEDAVELARLGAVTAEFGYQRVTVEAS